jgi:REP element-mobilizing transposase RayT
MSSVGRFLSGGDNIFVGFAGVIFYNENMTKARIYQNEFPYFVTSVTLDRRPIFENSLYAVFLAQNIFYYARKYQADIFCFAILPEHLHLLIKTNGLCDISRIMGDVKYRTAGDIRKFRNRFLRPPSLMPLALSLPPMARPWAGGETKADQRGAKVFAGIWKPRFDCRVAWMADSIRRIYFYIAGNWLKHGLPPGFSEPPYLYLDEDSLNSFL